MLKHVMAKEVGRPYDRRCGNECESGVADYMRFKICGVLVYIAYAFAAGKQTEVMIIPLVLNDVNATCKGSNGGTAAEYVLVGYAVVAMKRAVKASIEYHTAGIGAKFIFREIVNGEIIARPHIEILCVPVAMMV